MARTRGASNALHMDDGELVDREGKPLPTGIGAVERAAKAAQPVALPPAGAPPRPVRYVMNLKTLHRSMDAYDLAVLLDMIMGGLSHEISPTEYAAMHGNIRQHFRPVMAAVEDVK